MNLFSLNTLQLISYAEQVFNCDCHKKLTQLTRTIRNMPYPHYLVLGGGSNIVMPEKISGLVIRMALLGKSLSHETSTAWYVKAAAGENWHTFVLWTLAQGYAGLENLVLIPGTVGAAPVQNIGAYGVEIKDYLHKVVVCDLLSGEIVELTNTQCEFAYRDSVFKHRQNYLIIEVVFCLPKIPVLHIGYSEIQKELANLQLTATPQHIAHVVMKIRQRKLPNPAVLGNAGSFFKNPVISFMQFTKLLHSFGEIPHYVQKEYVKLAAGWLIEQAGWKGKRLGPVGMYEKQALVLVNYGGANACDVRALCDAVQRDVYARFCITIEPEPIFW